MLEDTREELESQLGRLNLSEAELRQLVRGQQDNITDLQKQLSAKEMAYLDARRKGESLEEQLRLSEERKRSLDRLHREASAELKRTQMELSRSTRSGTENDLRHQQTIRGLEGKVYIHVQGEQIRIQPPMALLETVLFQLDQKGVISTFFFVSLKMPACMFLLNNGWRFFSLRLLIYNSGSNCGISFGGINW